MTCDFLVIMVLFFFFRVSSVKLFHKTILCFTKANTAEEDRRRVSKHTRSTEEYGIMRKNINWLHTARLAYSQDPKLTGIDIIYTLFKGPIL